MSRTQVIVLFAMLSAATPSVIQAQSSLAEAAQKEAARRKEVKGTARVITNKDLPNVPPATAAPPDQTATPAATPTAAPAPDSTPAAPGDVPAKDPAAKVDETGGKHDEKYWRDRLANAKKKVEDSQVLVEALQSRINALTTDFVNRDDPAQRAVIANDRERAVAELDRLRKASVDGEKAVADLEEEARRAGVPPGWLR
jgi:hypothetical protein